MIRQRLFRQLNTRGKWSLIRQHTIARASSRLDPPPLLSRNLSFFVSSSRLSLLHRRGLSSSTQPEHYYDASTANAIPADTASTTSNNKSIEEMEMKSMRQRVSKLLSSPVGSMDMDTWFEADDLLKWWSAQQSIESVQTSFQLLDRFAQEFQAMPPPRDDMTEKDDLLLYFDARTTIPTMIENWFVVWKREAELRAAQQQPEVGNAQQRAMKRKTKPPFMELTPEEVMQRMDRYAHNIPWTDAFRLPGKVISYLFNATLLHPEPYNETAQFCDYLCDRMWEVMPRHSTMSPFMINTTLNLWARSTHPDQVQRAESLFARASDHNVPMDIVGYNTLLAVYGAVGLGHKADQLLQVLVGDYWRSGGQPNSSVPVPDDYSFHNVALAHANSGKGMAGAERASFLLNRLLDPFDDYGRLGIKVTNVLLNIILLAYSRANVPQAGDAAYKLLQQMKSNDLAPPDSISYGTVIDAFGESGQPEMAHKVFQEQLNAFEKTKDESIRPTVLSMSMLVQAYSKSSDPQRVKRATELLIQMFDLKSQGVLLEDPDVFAYNTVLDCIISSLAKDEVADKAVNFFRFMKKRAENGDLNAKPNNWTYTEMILMYSEKLNDPLKAEPYLREAHDDPSLKVDLRTIARYIITLSRNGYIQTADFWLHQLLDRCENEKGKSAMRPTTSLLGAVAAGWHRFARVNKDARVHVERLVHRYEQLFKAGYLTELPDVPVYGVLISFTRKDETLNDRADRVLQILQNMRQAAVENPVLGKKLMPDSAVYRNVTLSLIQDGQAEKASDLLLQMIRDFKSHQHRFPMPDSHIAGEVLDALSHLHTAEAWNKAQNIFQQMDDAGKTQNNASLLPIRDSRCYSAVIRLAESMGLEAEALALKASFESFQERVSGNRNNRRKVKGNSERKRDKA